MRVFTFIALAFVLICTAVAQTQKSPIDGQRIAFVAAFNKGDAATLEKIYEPDALILSFTAQIIRGGPMIAKGMTSMSGQYDLELIPIQSRTSGDMVYEVGNWSHYKKGSKSALKTGTYVWIWKKEKDDWQLEMLSVTAAPGVPIGK